MMPNTRSVAMRIVLSGLFWGTIVAALETVRLPLPDDQVSTFVAALASQLAVWSIVGILLVALLESIGGHLTGPARLAGFVLAASLAASALVSALFAWGPTWVDYASAGAFPGGRDAVGAYLYQAWIVAFYGGLYAWTHLLLAGSERQRARLARTRDARMRSEAALARARLDALRGHVDPAFLRRALCEVEQRYALAPAAGDRLMRRLVAFLRLAMPGIRSGRSTLAAEFALLRAHRELADALSPRTDGSRLDLPHMSPRTAFPSLLLLPLIEAFSDTSPGRSNTVRVRIRRNQDRIDLMLERDTPSHAIELPDNLLARVQVAMSRVFGSRWSMHTEVLPTASRFSLTFLPCADTAASIFQEPPCPTTMPTSFAAR